MRTPPRTNYPFDVPTHHTVLCTSMHGPWPRDISSAGFAMGCFWGAERLFWQTPGVYSTATGYAGGNTAYPTYNEVCTGQTGHTETVLVAYRTNETTFTNLMATFLEHHDPTQINRQGNDIGTQYRSAVFTTTTEDTATAHELITSFNHVLHQANYNEAATTVHSFAQHPFYYAEPEHQQYLHKVPHGYCNIGPNGLSCPTTKR